VLNVNRIMESTLANIEQLPLRILLVTGVVDDVNDTKHVVETVCSGVWIMSYSMMVWSSQFC